MTKKLKLMFSVEGGGTDMSVTLSSPKDALEADAIQTAASIVPVLENASGKAAVALTGAVYITTTEDAVI